VEVYDFAGRRLSKLELERGTMMARIPRAMLPTGSFIIAARGVEGLMTRRVVCLGE
jgi:hypothetical protein